MAKFKTLAPLRRNSGLGGKSSTFDEATKSKTGEDTQPKDGSAVSKFFTIRHDSKKPESTAGTHRAGENPEGTAGIAGDPDAKYRAAQKIAKQLDAKETLKEVTGQNKIKKLGYANVKSAAMYTVGGFVLGMVCPFLAIPCALKVSNDLCLAHNNRSKRLQDKSQEEEFTKNELSNYKVEVNQLPDLFKAQAENPNIDLALQSTSENLAKALMNKCSHLSIAQKDGIIAQVNEISRTDESVNVQKIAKIINGSLQYAGLNSESAIEDAKAVEGVLQAIVEDEKVMEGINAVNQNIAAVDPSGRGGDNPDGRDGPPPGGGGGTPEPVPAPAPAPAFTPGGLATITEEDRSDLDSSYSSSSYSQETEQNYKLEGISIDRNADVDDEDVTLGDPEDLGKLSKKVAEELRGSGVEVNDEKQTVADFLPAPQTPNGKSQPGMGRGS